ncbi:MAG: hypothetical protein QNJ55_26910 [Xenococcus sp. MO_188.B8]|nr:hypothetical protein [Xenococcus sp. MO_188.B8]
MDNPVIQTDIVDVLGQINQKLDKIDDRLGKLEVGQAEIKGDIKALDTKVEQLDKRVGNQEFTNRGVLVGLIVVILGSAAKFFGMVGNP